MTASLRVLAVEDEPLNRALLRATLARSGDERLATAVLTEVTSLAQARSASRENLYDVVLLDRRLPDGDGFELVPDLRRGAGPGRPIIVALTADAVPATRAAAMTAGCDAIMTKPYVPAELTALLAAQLDGTG